MHENWDHQPTPAVPGKNLPHATQQPTPARVRTTARPMMPAGPMAQPVSSSRTMPSNYRR
ncbi:hypothetical protein NA78x_002335 [Anatilimnocola sp. NA78]|uniref:hypothetical protein n=1 Tax=Anatilimnocola sp. NA78 TaxID=3415683 RepID=UPI003CE50BCA